MRQVSALILPHDTVGRSCRYPAEERFPFDLGRFEKIYQEWITRNYQLSSPKFMKAKIFFCNNSILKTVNFVFWHYMF